MRLLIVSPHLDIVGGVETYLRALVPCLVAEGIQIAVLSAGSPAMGDDSIVAGFPDIITWQEELRPADAIYREIAAWCPDVVYLNGVISPEIERRLTADFPIVMYAHNYYGTCISGTKCHSHAGWNTCERTLGPGCLAAYFPLGCGGRNPFTMWKLYRQQTRRRDTLQRYQKILVASRHMAEEYRRHGVAEERLQLVPLFPPESAPLAEPPSPRVRSNRLLFAGRLTLLKGLEHLLTALPQASQQLGRRLELIVAGDGPERERFEQIVRRDQLPVTFLGWVSLERTREAMLQADLLVVPSLWPEPFGLVGIEAGCVGLPATGFLKGGIPDWLIPGFSGEGTVATQPHDLAASIQRALSSTEHWNRLRAGAWETALQFTLQNHLQRLLPILNSAGRK